MQIDVHVCAILLSFCFFLVLIAHCTVITHMISVLKRRTLTHDYAIGIYVKLHCSNTFIMWVIAECNVQQLGRKNLKQLYNGEEAFTEYESTAVHGILQLKMQYSSLSLH